MSYILDALRRSEQERQRTEVPMQTAVALDAAPAEKSHWPLWLAAVIVLANIGILGTLLWQRLPSPQPVAVAVPAGAQSAQADSSLAQLAGSDRKAPILAAPTPTANAASPTLASAPSPTPAPVAEAARAASAPAVIRAPANSLDAPELATLPDDFRRSVPPIPVSIHVYAEQPAGRFVLIDMKRFGEGSQLPSGVLIEHITPNGLILAFRGQRFQLTVR